VPSLILGQEQSDVLQAAQILLTQLFETYPGSGQGGAASGVQVQITAATTPGGGVGTPVALTSAGVTTVGGSSYQYTWSCPASTEPGDYLVTWTGTVGGTLLTYSQSVTVAAMPGSTPAPGQYATVQQYQSWSGDTSTPIPMVATWLMRASEDMDAYLIGAVYPVNQNGMPTDAMAIDAFMRACCAQCQFLIGDNDPAGLKRQYVSTSAGGVSAVRAAAMTALQFPPLGPRAASILHTAGVLPNAPLVAW
jgi:hypothetical protein